MQNQKIKNNLLLASTKINKNNNVRKLHLAKAKVKQAGFNALELTLVLAVIAIAIVGVVRVMGSNTEKSSSNQMVNNVGLFIMNIRNAYSSSITGYSTLDNKTAINLKVVPSDLRILGEVIKSQFPKGKIVVKGDGNDAFTITYNFVPSNVCVSAVNALGGSSFVKITINGTEVYDVERQALDPVKVAEQCKGSNGTGVATIIFTAG